jgi:hypothetical protein
MTSGEWLKTRDTIKEIYLTKQTAMVVKPSWLVQVVGYEDAIIEKVVNMVEKQEIERKWTKQGNLFFIHFVCLFFFSFVYLHFGE